MRFHNRTAAVFGALLFSAHIINLSAAAEDSVCFILREYEGKIALFDEDCIDAEPLAVYNMPVTDLFPGDIALLREGVRLKNRSEVARLLADLGVEY